MVTLMFSESVRKNNTFNRKGYPLPSEKSFSDYKYTRNLEPRAYFKIDSCVQL